MPAMPSSNPAEAILKTSSISIAALLVLTILSASCSKSAITESTPEEKLRQARIDIDKKHYEKAGQALEELTFSTTGTRLGGEVQFLLGETNFKRGKYPEAESYYAAYLNAFPAGPYSENALYMQALSKVKQVQKLKIGLLSFRKQIPHDRDISLLREARVLFEIYVEKYPTGEWAQEAAEQIEDLLLKEGRHELEIAKFYLKKKSYRAASQRARNVLDGQYPDSLKEEARAMIDRAERSDPSVGNDQEK